MSIKSIMIIDDSEMDQYLAKYMIKKYDASIETLQTYDGQEALEVLQSLEKQPDLIFLDINMPRMNGHEFLEKYDNWEGRSEVVIMLTSSDQEQDKEKSMAFKCVKKYCIKPMELPDLKSLITDECH